MAGAVPAIVLLSAVAFTHGVSPVQKVVELLDECKAKVQKDIDAEAKAMEDYTAFCDKELEEKGYAIKTATREIDELAADIADNSAIISSMEDVIAQTGSDIAKKDKELYDANAQRKAKYESFVAAEKEMLNSVDELTRAAGVIKGGGGAFLQASALPPKVRGAINALKAIVTAGRLDFAGSKRLHSFLQQAEQAKEDAEDGQEPAAEEGGASILETVEDMQKKAEDSLSELRQTEIKDNNSFELVKQDLESRITNFRDKLDSSKKEMTESQEKLAAAEADTVGTKKSKAADEDYAGNLKTQCDQTALAWDERKKSAVEEMGAITKAKEILVSGVKAAFVQNTAVTHRAKFSDDSSAQDDDAASKEDAVRTRVVDILRGLSKKYRSYGLAMIATQSASDPFVKLRGLIEDMISKLVKEAQEDATHEAFCQEEMGKSKESKEEKESTLEKHSVRIAQAEATIAELTKTIKNLEAEIAEIDASQAKATKIRAEENAEYKTSSSDFRQSAEAVARAIEVLKNYYEGALLQVQAQVGLAQPAFGGAKGDTGSSIISILEMSQEDFTRLLAETEEGESQAAEEFEKLTEENKVSRAAKASEAKAAASTVKSSKLSLENYKEDHASVSAELDAVLAYLDKLKPECESTAMSFAERKAAREAEIGGLKDALEILSGQGM